jgi:serine/threonine-protein kinase
MAPFNTNGGPKLRAAQSRVGSGLPEDYNSHSEHTVVFLVAPGDILDERWLIEARIGQGAMGSVFRGTDNKLERRVAIKILAPEHCRKPKVLARFEREAKLMTTLRHPNIIQLFGVGRRGALPYIVMQFLEGMTLADVLKKKGGKLTPGETLAVVKQIAAGLSFIHHHGLVHRDIKPQNIFVSPGGRVTILDLGVVRDKSNPGLTKPGAMVGTPYYMSPEQITGTDEIDKRTDVYALAAMTFELLCGRPPFLGTTNFEVLHAHRYSDVPDASELNKAVSKQAAKALANAMSKKREDRPLSASEFAADLEAFFGSAQLVDPAVAFAFLDELKEDAKKERNRGTKSTRAPTVAIKVPEEDRPKTPPVKAPPRTASQEITAAKAPAPRDGQDDRPRTSGGLKTLPRPASQEGAVAKVAADERPRLSGGVKPLARLPSQEITAAKVPAGRTQTSGEMAIPQQARTSTSGEVPMAKSHDVVELVGAATGPVEITANERPAADPSDTQAGSEDMSPPSDTSAEKGSDTRDEEHSGRTDPGKSDEPGNSDPGATVTESGELRVITTLKGLTTSAVLFVDGRKQGSTPSSLQVPSGRHMVRVERQGFKPVEKPAQVTANQVTLVRIELGPGK